MTNLTFPKAIIFDWDGTIIDSLPLVHEAMNHARAAFGLEPETLEQTHKNSVLGGEVIFRRDWGDDRWTEARAKFLEYFLAQHLVRFGTPEERKVYPQKAFMPGGYELLEWLKEKGVPCGVLTNRTRTSAGEEIPYLGYQDFFKALVCYGEAPKNKPDGAAAHFILEKMGVTAGPDVWIVGDTWGDMRCGADAGLTSVLVYDGQYNEEPAPAAIFATCHNLLVALKALC